MADPRQPGSDEPDEESDDAASGSGSESADNRLEELLARMGIGKEQLAGNMSFAQLDEVMQQLQGMLGSLTGPFGAGGAGDGGVNWELTKDTARKVTASLGPDPTPSSAQVEQVVDAVSIAEVWLDSATDFPRVGTRPLVWSRATWVEETMSTWRRLVEPVATHIADAMAATVKIDESDAAAAAEAAGMPLGADLTGLTGMMQPMLRSAGSSMFGMQLGQGLGRLSTEVVGATDIGLPLHDRVALVPTNIAAFGQGLDQTSTDVILYLALRECARQRLFAGVGWLRAQLLTLVESYARGIAIDTTAMEQAVSEIDTTDLTELSKALEGSLFTPTKTPAQLTVLGQLETVLALVEGWVDEVVAQATARWMPAADALAETVRRRRATGGPAEATFASLIGLELRPRRMRDAANLWAALRDARGAEGRDAVWSHPDLAPTAADLDDPIGFVRGEGAAAPTGGTDPGPTGAAAPMAADEFDSELARLLEAEAKMDQAAGPEPDPADGPDGDQGDGGSRGDGDSDGHGDDPRPTA